MESSISEIMYKEYSNFALIFKCDYQDNMQELINNIKSIVKKDKTYCGKKIKDYAWICKTCAITGTAYWCNDCFDMNNHKGHIITNTTCPDGNCDCGLNEKMKDTGFCSIHQGLCKSEIQIESYVKSIFEDDKLNLIVTSFSNLFNAIKPLIVNQSINDNPENKRLLSQFLSFLIKICNANQVFIFILTQILIKQYDYDTIHQCFIITKDTSEIMSKETIETVHKCTCPIMVLLINAYKDYDQLNEFLLLLHYDYRAEQMIYLSLFCLYDHVIINDNTIIENTMMNLPQRLSTLVLNQQTIINYYTETIYDMLRKSIQEKTAFKRVLNSLHHWNGLITLLVIKDQEKTIDKTREMFKRYIDLICLFHNCVTNEEVIKMTEEDIKDLVMIERALLSQVAIMINLLLVAYCNKEKYSDTVAAFYEYFFNKFKDKTVYRQLSSSEYSFHITLYRAFSLLVIKQILYHIYYSSYDLIEALETPLQMTDYDFTEMLREVLKCIGFIYACRQIEWVDIVEDLTIINELYHRHATFHDCDCSLLKLFCLLKEYSYLLSLQSLLNATDINDSYESLSTYCALDSIQQQFYAKENDLHKEVEYLKDLRKLQTLLFESTWFIMKVFFKKAKDYILSSGLVNLKLIALLKTALIPLLYHRTINNLIITDKTCSSFLSMNDRLKICLFTDYFKNENWADKLEEIVIRIMQINNDHDQQLSTFYEKRNLVYLLINQLKIPLVSIEENVISSSKELTNAILNINLIP